MLAVLVGWLAVACDPRPCRGRCDAVEVASARAGAGATDCGLARIGEDRTAVDACMANEFAADRPFFGVVEESAATADATLLRGYSRTARGELREIVGTRQGTRTVVHTRVCFSATVEPGPSLGCTEPVDGLFIECDCTESASVDGGNPPG